MGFLFLRGKNKIIVFCCGVVEVGSLVYFERGMMEVVSESFFLGWRK